MKQANLLERAAAQSAAVRLETVAKEITEIARTAYCRAIENPASLAAIVDKFRQDSWDVLYDTHRDLEHESDRRKGPGIKLHEPTEAPDCTANSPVDYTIGGCGVSAPVAPSDRTGA